MTIFYCALQIWLLAPALWMTQEHNRICVEGDL